MKLVVHPRGVVDKATPLAFFANSMSSAMSTKLEYLQKYLSKESADGKSKKGKKKVKKRSNLVILDDDVDWKELVPQPGELDFR